jgi:triphosphoribosyl-dephospho-CoA synthetase
MKKKTEIEMERQRTLKIARTLITLKHRLAAEEEMNNILPDTLAEFDKSLQGGVLLRLQANLNDILGDL